MRVRTKRSKLNRKRNVNRRGGGLNQQCREGLKNYEDQVREWIRGNVVQDRGSFVTGNDLVQKCHNALGRSINRGTFGRMLKEIYDATSVRVDGVLFYVNIKLNGKKNKKNEEKSSISTVCFPIAGPKVQLIKKNR
ncbi:unnamed protein product [Dimorphilus gyrociliatus]|uniref:Uncharacterized protein n=1 Tax=Dimorphilus gyrociliatus TaxID=2664684 RepID=A0A7I8W1H8_9ANNE|nr:unnamed protein product [Dimorphilus gyrociliatus]